MANKCLRKFLRSGRFLLFTHPPSHSATRKLLPKLHPLQHKLYPNDPNILSPIHLACLPHLQRLPAAPSSSSPSPSSIPAAHDYTPSRDVELHGHVELHPPAQLLHDDHLHQLLDKQLLRSHSCSKLQCSRLRMPASLKSLLHRTHSHSNLAGARHDQVCRSFLNAAHEDAEGAERSLSTAALSSTSGYTQAWSSPTLQIRCHGKKGARSFHGELQRASSKGSKVRTPKGHVAVYVDGGRERHVVPISYLSHPYFQDLLQRAENEFGFAQKGGLLIPCSPAEFHQTLHQIALDQLSHTS